MSLDSAIEKACTVCGQGFLIPDAERRFRQDRGLHEPEECPTCRARLRAARNAGMIAIYDRVDTPSTPGSGRAGSEPRTSTRGGRPGRKSNVAQQRYNTVCAQCGKETQVPFVPRGDRPVYCRDCFNARRGR